MIPPEASEPWNDIPDPFPPGPIPEVPPPPSGPSLTRDQRARRLRVAAFLSAAWVIAFAVLLGIRPDAAQPAIAAQLGAWSAAVPFGLLVALRTTASGFPPGVRAVAIGLAVLAALFAGLAELPAGGHKANLSVDTVRGCATVALVFALPPAGMAAFVLRRGFLNAPALRGALVGAVCGLSGAAGVHAHCQVVTPSHVLVAHGLSILMAAAAGALLGARFGRA